MAFYGWPYFGHHPTARGPMPRPDSMDDLFWPMEMFPRQRSDDMLSHMFDNWDSLFALPLESGVSRDNASEPSTSTAVATAPGNQLAAKGFSMDVPLKHFKPSEIKVKSSNGCVFIDAETERNHEHDGMKTHMRREFHKVYQLPEGVKEEEVKCSFNRKGVLRVTAPVPEIEAPKHVDIPISMEVEDDENVEPKKVEGAEAAAGDQ